MHSTPRWMRRAAFSELRPTDSSKLPYCLLAARIGFRPFYSQFRERLHNGALQAPPLGQAGGCLALAATGREVIRDGKRSSPPLHLAAAGRYLSRSGGKLLHWARPTLLSGSSQSARAGAGAGADAAGHLLRPQTSIRALSEVSHNGPVKHLPLPVARAACKSDEPETPPPRLAICSLRLKFNSMSQRRPIQQPLD